MTMTTIITTISTIIAWLIGKECVLPQIMKLWDWFRNKKKETDIHQIDVSGKLAQVADSNNNVYEGQIEFLNKQVITLEEQIAKGEEEKKRYLSEISDLRKQLLEVQEVSYKNKAEIAKLMQMCCKNVDCKCREKCDNN